MAIDWNSIIEFIDWNFIIGSILGTIFGFLSSLYLWDIQNNYHRKKIASSLKTEILKLNHNTRPIANIDKINQIFSWQGDNTPFILPIYRERDLYYSVRTDISLFDEEVASKIHEFYTNIIDAEKFRLMLIQEQDFRFSKDLLDSLIPIDRLTWEIIPMLEKEIRQNILFPRYLTKYFKK